MELTLDQVVEATGARPSEVNLNTPVRGWSIDSRTTAPGDLFIAIRGGHAHVPMALERGAVAALVSEPSLAKTLHVADTVLALQQLASYARDRAKYDVIGLTGSAGKTSTKDIIADLLSTRFKVGKTVGNLNNHIGLPLSILRLRDDAQIAVLEMGMNHAGEIRALAEIAKPRIGLVTNVGYAHVEFFNSIDEIAAAKRELIEGLQPDGIAILNADDERVSKFRHPGQKITYGFSRAADIHASNSQTPQTDPSRDRMERSHFTVNGIPFETQLPGRHSISNILAGLAVASVYEIPLQELVEPVSALRPAKMRGERIVRNGITILDDSYNSNPEAARHMIDCLRAETAERRIAVLGEMLELGHMAEPLHRELGSYAANAGLNLVIGVAGAARFIVDEASHKSEAHFFLDADSAGTFLKQFVQPGDAVLFKGSRGTHVERALATMEA